MKFKKRLIAFLLIPVISITLILNSIYTAYAITPGTVIGILGLLGSTGSLVLSAEQDSVYSNWYDANIDKLRDSWANSMQALGMPSVLTDKLKNVAMMDIIQHVRRWMVKNTPGSNPTDDEVKEQIYNMYKDCVILENGDFRFSSDLNSFLQDECDYFIDNTDPFVSYSFNIYDYASNFSNGLYFDRLKNFCLEYQNDYQIIKFDVNTKICLVPNGLYAGKTSTSIWNNGTACTSDVYNLTSWDLVPNNDDFRLFVWNGTDFVENGLYKNGLEHIFSQVEDNVIGNNISTAVCYVSYGLNYPVLIFRDLGALKEWGLGKQPYYFNRSVYNDWRQSTGDYTVTTDNSNHVTYGDIDNHIENIHNETNTYPGVPAIERWIEQQPVPTPIINPGTGDNPGSGTSGSGGAATASANNQGVNVTVNNNHSINFPDWFRSDTVSGNTVSGNSSGDGSGISFGFLGSLGQTLKSLIENIGKAIVDIITGISSVIAEIVTNIPTVFGDFVGAVLGWLPPELQALISLSVIAMITYGLIKLIRG